MSRTARAVKLWKQGLPYGGCTDREEQAFIDGFNFASKPLPMSQDDLMESAKAHFKRLADAEAARLAALPDGVCPACEGEGRQGGQFTGGSWECQVCGGTGTSESQ